MGAQVAVKPQPVGMRTTTTMKRVCGYVFCGSLAIPFYAALSMAIFVLTGMAYHGLYIIETEPRSVANDALQCSQSTPPISTIALFADVHIDPIFILSDITTRQFLSQEVRNHKLDGAVILGDMITWGGGPSSDSIPSEWVWQTYADRFFWALRPVYDSLPSVLIIPGNHDVDYGALPGRYLERFGDSNKYAHVGNFTVFLHNCMDPCNRLAFEQWDDVDAPCNLAPPPPGVEVDFIASHIPGLNGFAEQVVPVVKPKAVFSGHEHRGMPIYRHEHNYTSSRGERVIVSEIEAGTTYYKYADGPLGVPAYIRLSKYADGCMEYVVVAADINGKSVFALQMTLAATLPLALTLGVALCVYLYRRRKSYARCTHRTYVMLTEKNEEQEAWFYSG